MSGISLQQSTSAAVEPQALLSTILGRNYTAVLAELSARALCHDLPARKYWEQHFSSPSFSNSRHLKDVEKALRPCARALLSAIPEQTVLIDLACGPTSVMENFFKQQFGSRVSAWIGVDIVPVAEGRKSENRLTQFGNRIHADMLDFLEVLLPDVSQYSFYLGSWPYALTEHYERAALGYIQLLMKPGSLVFCNSANIIPYFAAQSEDFNLLCSSGFAANRIAVFQKLSESSQRSEQADVNRLVLPHAERQGKDSKD